MLDLSNNIKWYSLDNILKNDAQYYIIMGERSNGKTFSTLKYIIDTYFESNQTKLFGYTKRYEEDIKGTLMDNVFAPLEDYLLEKYNKKIKFYRKQWLVYDADKEGKISECELFGYAFALNKVERTKGTSYPKIDTLLFEEFMSIDCSYLPDEINLLLNLVSTIARYRTNVKVFMLANTITKYCPYITALGLKVHRMEKGKIVTKQYTDKKGFNTKFAIERTANVNVFDNADNTNKTVYNIFGNSGVGNMITSGDFETHKYKTNIDNYTFEENRYKGSRIIGKQYRTSFVLKFEDYYYRIFLIDDNTKPLTAYREIDENSITMKNTTHVINGTKVIQGVVNVNTLYSFNGYIFNEIIDIIASTIKQKDFIVVTDDDGENVVNGFRLSGFSYTH